MKKYHKWTEQEVEFLRKYANRYNDAEIAGKLGFSVTQVKNALRRYQIKRDPQVTQRFRQIKRRWSHKDWAFVVTHYMVMGYKEISKVIGHSPNAIQMKLHKHGLYLPKNIFEMRERKARFKAGHTPWNKGLKGIHLSPATEFKKGNSPWNTKRDGCITVRDTNRTPYKYIRLSSGKWVLYHRWLWEQHYGPIPPGHIIAFKNGNTLDVRIENLMLISRAENANRNRNNQKASETLKKVWAEGRFHLSDRYIANLLAPRNPELRARVLENKELLEIKRLQIKLKQAIREVNP